MEDGLMVTAADSGLRRVKMRVVENEGSWGDGEEGYMRDKAKDMEGD
jgi:hypothetical protein